MSMPTTVADETDLFHRISDSFSQQNFLSFIGAKLEKVEYGMVEVVCERNQNLLQQQGLLHGGVITTLADVACGYAALTCMPAGSEVLSVELKINFMRPALSRHIIATGQVLKSGKTLVIAEAAITDENGALIAKMLSTMMTTKFC